jgi:hypothetical protein
MKLSKIISTVFLSLSILACGGANAKIVTIEDRDAIRVSSNNSQTILYFDTGRICESTYTYDAGVHCANWNVNPIQADFFVKKCEGYAKDKRLCSYYKKTAPSFSLDD